MAATGATAANRQSPIANRQSSLLSIANRPSSMRIRNRRSTISNVSVSGGYSSAVERRTVAPEVAGSNPVTHPTYNPLMIRHIAPQFFTVDLPATLAYYRDKLGFDCLGKSREFVVKDCDGRLLAFGSDVPS